LLSVLFSFAFVVLCVDCASVMFFFFFFFFSSRRRHTRSVSAFLLNRSSDLLFQELDAVIHLLMEAKHWGLRKSRNATSLNSRFKSLDTLKVKIISVTFRSEERRVGKERRSV